MLTSYSRRPEPKAWEIVTCCVCTVYTLSTSTTSKQWHLLVAAVDAYKSSLSSSLDGLFCASADNIYFSTLVKGCRIDHGTKCLRTFLRHHVGWDDGEMCMWMVTCFLKPSDT